MQYKAIISDVDGTLIQQGFSDAMYGKPTQKVIDAVTKAAKTIQFGIATSRPLMYANHLFAYVPISGPSIFHGGSIIVNAQDKRILWKKTLGRDSVDAVLDIIQKYDIHFMIHTTGYEEDVVMTRSKHISHSPLNMFLAELPEKQLDEVHQELKKIPDIAINRTPSFTSGLWGFDITHAEATKQHGILQVAELLNIYPEEIIGIGDGYNDLPLLMACGLKVAMGNAVEDLKAIADYVAPAVDEDGLANVIEKFIV